MLNRKKREARGRRVSLEFGGSDDSSELPSIAEQLAQAIAGPPRGI